jgi:hypothetical protein
VTTPLSSMDFGPHPDSDVFNRDQEAPHSAWRQSDLLDLLAGLIAIGLSVMVHEGWSGPTRTLLALGFTLFVPGRAIVTNWPRMARWSEVAMSMVFSLAILGLLAAITLWAHAWSPRGLFQAEAWLSIAALCVGIGRRH